MKGFVDFTTCLPGAMRCLISGKPCALAWSARIVHPFRFRIHMFSSCRLAVMCSLGLMLPGCSNTPHVSVSPANGNDYWSRRLQETWLPTTQAAANQFLTFTRQADLPRLHEVPRILLKPDSNGSHETSSVSGPSPRIEIALLPKDTVRQLQSKAVVYPLESLTDQLAAQLSAGHEDAIPYWMRAGSRYVFTEQIIGQLQLENLVRSRRSDQESWLRSPACPGTQALLAQADNSSGSLESIYASGWMLLQLQDLTGQRFMAGWQQYFRRAATPGFDHSRDFEQSFGLSPDEFARQLASRLQSLRDQPRRHARTPPQSTGYAQADDLSSLPLKPQSAKAAYGRYLEARAPKAFALSLRGQWAYVDDDSTAMDHALALCRQYDPVSCQLYAVDDQVVYQNIAQGNSIEVIMASTGDDAWTQSIATNWQPVIQTTANAFNTGMNTLAGVTLDASARIYVTTTREDYAPCPARQPSDPLGRDSPSPRPLGRRSRRRRSDRTPVARWSGSGRNAATGCRAGSARARSRNAGSAIAASRRIQSTTLADRRQCGSPFRETRGQVAKRKCEIFFARGAAHPNDPLVQT